MNVEGEGEGSIHHEDPVNYADKSGCDPVNLDEHEGSIPSDFVDIREYLAGNKDPHQNMADSNEGVLQECFIEPKEKKEVEQVEPHIHESALTYSEESSSYELSNKEMESKRDIISSPTCSLPGIETSMEHKLESQADKNLLEKENYDQALQIAERKTEMNQLKLELKNVNDEVGVDLAFIFSGISAVF